MAVAFILKKQLVAASANAICLQQAPAVAGNLLLNGALVAGGVGVLDSQRRVLITSGGNDLGVNYTVYGTNDAGTAIQETVAGTNGATVATLQDFKTVTRVTNSAAVAAPGVSVGTNGTGSTPWFVPNPHTTPFEVALAYELVSGAQNASVEISDDEVLAPISIYSAGFNQLPPVPTNVFVLAGMTAMIANTEGDVTRTCRGIRLTVNSGLGSGQLVIRQVGIATF